MDSLRQKRGFCLPHIFNDLIVIENCSASLHCPCSEHVHSPLSRGQAPDLSEISSPDRGGGLDEASEGLLLLSNDSAWNSVITDPATQVDKLYHVQIGRMPDAGFLARLHQGVRVDGELLRVKAARELRRGGRNAWLEITLEEGKNRHLRRLLAACDCNVLRLIRIGIGPLRLGTLAKGAWRHLTPEEVRLLSAAGTPAD